MNSTLKKPTSMNSTSTNPTADSTTAVKHWFHGDAVSALDDTADTTRLVEDELDFVEEMRLRTWACRNHVPPVQRVADWHPVILHEMARIDRDAAA